MDEGTYWDQDEAFMEMNETFDYIEEWGEMICRKQPYLPECNKECDK